MGLSTPISRLRSDVLHAPKATNPRAVAATAANTPIAFNTLTDNPYQPLTSHLLRTESGIPCPRVPLMERTHLFHCNSGTTLRGDSPLKTSHTPDLTVSKRNHADKVKRGPG
jgi:hypothetical protein